MIQPTMSAIIAHVGIGEDAEGSAPAEQQPTGPAVPDAPVAKPCGRSWSIAIPTTSRWPSRK